MFTSAKLKTIKLTYKFLSSHLIFFNLSVYYLNLSLSFLLLLLQFFTQKAYQSVHTLWYAQITIQIYSIYYLYIFLIVPSLIFMMFRPFVAEEARRPSASKMLAGLAASVSTSLMPVGVMSTFFSGRTSVPSAPKLSKQKYAGVFMPWVPLSVLVSSKPSFFTLPRELRST